MLRAGALVSDDAPVVTAAALVHAAAADIPHTVYSFNAHGMCGVGAGLEGSRTLQRSALWLELFDKKTSCFSLLAQWFAHFQCTLRNLLPSAEA